MKGILKKINIKFNNVFFAFCSLFWKRDKSIILFGSWFGSKFADNSRFLFQYLSNEKEKLGLSHVIWVTLNENVYNIMTDMGYEVYMMYSPESIYFHKKAGYHFVCNTPNSSDDFHGDILGQYSYRAIKVNLWHGATGLKGVGASSNQYIEKRNKHRFIYNIKDFFIKNSSVFRKLTSPGGWGDCYFLSTTDYTINILKMHFLLPDHNYIKSGLPRNCDCNQLTTEEKTILDMINQYSYVILYLPTFRDSTDSRDLSLLSEEVKNELVSKNILWIQKGHSADKNFGRIESRQNNILLLNPNFDINVLYKKITLILTDYSSVMVDAVYYDKPVWFYVPDYNEYINRERGFVADPKEMMCGPKFFDIHSLKSAILNIDKIDKAKYFENYRYPYLKEKYWGKNRTISEIWMDILKHVN